MDDTVKIAEQNFVQGMSRIADFWGAPRAMGAIFAVVYLSKNPVTLDELVVRAGVTKGSVSTNIRNLERLGLVHKQIVVGDRKDYYLAETDFWKIVKDILREREKNEFNQAILSVKSSLSLLESEGSQSGSTENLEHQEFCKERINSLAQFFDSLDNIVATILTINDLKGNFINKLTKV